MWVNNQQHFHVDASLSGPDQGLLKLFHHIILERVLGFRGGVYDPHLRLVPEIKLEAAVDGSASQDTIMGIRNSPREDIVHCSSGPNDLDHVWRDGVVWLKIFVEVDGQGFGETWTSCMAAAVEKVIEREGDLGCKSGFGVWRGHWGGRFCMGLLVHFHRRIASTLVLPEPERC